MSLTPAANRNVTKMTHSVSKFIEGDIDMSRLLVQLPMVQDMIETVMNGSIRKTTNLRTIAQAMDKSNIYKNMLSEIDKLLKVHFTIPITSTTAERGFSFLLKIENLSIMTQCRLNNLY